MDGRISSNNVTAHGGLGTLPNALKELWFETGGSCHLRCSYCFAESGGLDESPDNVSIGRIKAYLHEFKKLGGERIGLVGAGEPFHPRNIRDTFEILDLVRPLQLKTTVFTTADLLDGRSIKQLEQYPNLLLLVKYNSRICEIQDAMVNVKDTPCEGTQ